MRIVEIVILATALAFAAWQIYRFFTRGPKCSSCAGCPLNCSSRREG
jgi:hypothetical protein